MSHTRRCLRHPARLTRSAAALYCSTLCQTEAAQERAKARRTSPEPRHYVQSDKVTTEAFVAEPQPSAFYDVLNGVTPCVYCGLPADTVDHTFPQSIEGYALDQLGALATAPRMKHSHQIVPACRECNSLLGARLFKTFAQRKACLKDLLRARYRRHLNAPAWSDSEIARLGHSLRTSVASFQAAKRIAHLRVAW